MTGSKEQMMQDGELTHIGALSAGPVPEEELVAWRPPDIIYDDISEAPLDPVKVAKAQQDELDWIHDQGVYTKVDMGVLSRDGKEAHHIEVAQHE